MLNPQQIDTLANYRRCLEARESAEKDLAYAESQVSRNFPSNTTPAYVVVGPCFFTITRDAGKIKVHTKMLEGVFPEPLPKPDTPNPLDG